MFLRKANSTLFTILLILILGNFSLVNSTSYQNDQRAICQLPLQNSNFQSPLKIQFQFQAYTNIYSEFDIKPDTHSNNRTFHILTKSNNPSLDISAIAENKELELCSFWTKNKILKQLLPFHGFS